MGYCLAFSDEFDGEGGWRRGTENLARMEGQKRTRFRAKRYCSAYPCLPPPPFSILRPPRRNTSVLAPFRSILAAVITGEAILIIVLATTLGVMLPTTTVIGTMAEDMDITGAAGAVAVARRCHRFESRPLRSLYEG